MATAVRTVAIRRHSPTIAKRRLQLCTLPFAAASLPSLAVGTADRPAIQPDAPAVELYIDRESGAHLTRLVTETLADLGTGPAIESCSSLYSCAISADGLTVVMTDGGWPADDASSPRSTVVVRDGLGGAERARLELPGHLTMPRLGDDGTRLVVQRFNDADQEAQFAPSHWDNYRTADGDLLATVEAEGPNGWRESRVDPAAERLYRFLVFPVAGGTSLCPVELVAHDLQTGADIGRFWLPEGLAGRWTTERVVDGDRIKASLMPALAVSPDGRQVALVHADREAVTLIDAEHVAVERTIVLTQPTDLANRVLGFLSPAPQSAQAKEPGQGSTVWATYAVDGRFLYVWSQTGHIADDGRGEFHATDLKLVDLETGEIRATALDRVGVHSLHLMPDGRCLYVLGWDQSRSLNVGKDVFPLLRLDAQTLETVAIRPFNAVNLPGQVIVQPEPGA